jgi:hypothetical protein
MDVTCQHDPWMFKCSSTTCEDSEACELFEHTAFWKRHESTTQLGESCLVVLDERYDHIDWTEHGVHLKFGYGTSFEETFQCLKKSQAAKYNSRQNTTSMDLKFVLGDPSSAAIYSADKAEIPRQSSIFNPQQLESIFVPETMNAETVSNFILRELSYRPEILPLMACAAVADVYKLMPDATISTRVLSHPLSEARWVVQSHSKGSISLSRPQTFACISMFDSGNCDLDPAALQEVFAMSSGNSIFVSGALLCDPHEVTQPCEIRRVVGNIGQAGVSLLMGPPNPEIRQAELEHLSRVLPRTPSEKLPCICHLQDMICRWQLSRTSDTLIDLRT